MRGAEIRNRECSRHSGTGKSCRPGKETMTDEAERLTALRDSLKEAVLGRIGESWLNGHPSQRLPSNLNFGFKYIEGESLVLLLDARGIAASTGSACSSKKLAASHVLTAIGLAPEECHGSLRITLGRSNTLEDIDYASQVIEGTVSASGRCRLWARGEVWQTISICN